MNEHRYREDVINAISLQWTSLPDTDTAEALNRMNSVMFTSPAGDSSQRDNIAIVITDGRSVNRCAALSASFCDELLMKYHSLWWF